MSVVGQISYSTVATIADLLKRPRLSLVETISSMGTSTTVPALMFNLSFREDEMKVARMRVELIFEIPPHCFTIHVGCECDVEL